MTPKKDADYKSRTGRRTSDVGTPAGISARTRQQQQQVIKRNSGSSSSGGGSSSSGSSGAEAAAAQRQAAQRRQWRRGGSGAEAAAAAAAQRRQRRQRAESATSLSHDNDESDESGKAGGAAALSSSDGEEEFDGSSDDDEDSEDEDDAHSDDADDGADAVGDPQHDTLKELAQKWTNGAMADSSKGEYGRANRGMMKWYLLLLFYCFVLQAGRYTAQDSAFKTKCGPMKKPYSRFLCLKWMDYQSRRTINWKGSTTTKKRIVAGNLF